MPRYKPKKQAEEGRTPSPCPFERAVAESTDHLYEVFCIYRFTDMEGDLAFPGSCDPKPLLAKPLRALEPEAFERFAWKAVTTWGNADDLRHFLPRMLELTTDGGDLVHLERWIVYSKMSYAKWRSWPHREQSAAEAYFHAVFDQLIHKPVADYQGMKSAWFPNYTFLSKDARLSDAVTGFLCDLLDADAGLIPNLLAYWSRQLDDQAPLLALAYVYLDKHYSETGLYGDWLRSAGHVDRLAQAWETHQGDPALSTIYSDAHASAVRFVTHGSDRAG